jgi:ribosomal protein L35
MKLKNRKAAVKRVKKKKNLFNRKKANKRHLLKSKNSKRLRRLSAPSRIHRTDSKTFELMIPY